MKIKNTFEKGFTLVELLIVIALIGILATALVATLDPIEQINKARDSRFKNDAAELLAAIERYYASTQDYPWTAEDASICGSNGSTECTDETQLGATGQTSGVGVCGDDTCSTTGVLVSAGELKDSFAKKTQFTSDETVEQLYVRRTDEGNSIYVCFIPKSDTNRESATLTDIHDGSNYIDPTDTCSDPGESWDTLGDTCFICVPEVGSEGLDAGSTAP